MTSTQVAAAVGAVVVITVDGEISGVAAITEDEVISEAAVVGVTLLRAEVVEVTFEGVVVILTLVGEVAEVTTEGVQGAISGAGVEELAAVIFEVVEASTGEVVVEAITEVVVEEITEAVVEETTEAVVEGECPEEAARTDGTGVMTGITKEPNRMSRVGSK